MEYLQSDIIEPVKKSLIPATLYALIGVFLVIISMFFIPAVGELIKGPLLFLLPFFIFSLLGAALIFLTIKGKVKGKLKKFLILTGASAAGFFVSTLLHNFLYALAIITSHIVILKYIFEFLHATFFIIAIFVCPSGFLIGVVGSIVLFIKKRK